MHQPDLVDLALDKARGHMVCNFDGVAVFDPLEIAETLRDLDLAPPVKILRLGADKRERHAVEVRPSVGQRCLGALQDVGVESPTEPPVRSHHEEFGAPRVLPRGQEGLRRLPTATGGNLLEGVAHSLGVGPRGGDRLLRAPQFGRGDHPHRARDLLRLLDAADPAANVLEVRHR